jgi:hypothetical protein
VVLKYIRAILPVLQQVETLEIQLTPCDLVVQVDLPDYRLTTTLKSQKSV